MKKLSTLMSILVAAGVLSQTAEAARSRLFKPVIKTPKVVVKKQTTTSKVVIKIENNGKVTINSNGQPVVIENNKNDNTPAKNIAKKANLGAVSGVATVAATNQYNNVNHVNYGIATVSGTHQINLAKGDVNKLVVDGKEIDLLPEKQNQRGATMVTDGNTTLNVGHYLTYATHGNYMVKKDANGNSLSIMFFQGNETPVDKIPTAGKANYRGIAIESVVNAQDGRKSVASAEATSEFAVDFDKKRIEGTIKPLDKQLETVQLSGNIKENRIEGDYKNNLPTMEGRFYGPNAEEMAGQYYVVEPNKQYINGTFGAKKQ